jgi:serine protease Do
MSARTLRKVKYASGTVLAVVALAVLGSMFTVGDEKTGSDPAKLAAARQETKIGHQEAIDYATALSQTFRKAAEKVLPSVVTIQRTIPASPAKKNATPERNFGFDDQNSPFGDRPTDPFLRRFFEDLPNLREIPRGPQRSAGSGVIIDSNGTILTNNHVVSGGGKVVVRLHDGREFEAAEVRTDPKTDLAVIRLKGARSLPAAALGDSDQLQIGDWVIAAGQPFGLADTVTAGIISAKGRGLGITAREEFLQTDAAINPGNSGGPLVNLHGEVIGINTAISTTNGGYQGVGFAIPINLAKWVSQQLTEHGSVKRAYLGIGIQQVTSELSSQLGMQSTAGALVTEVRPNSPASEAKIQPGDVVVEYGGNTISEPRDLQGLVEQSTIGSKQALVVLRDGKRVSLELTVREQPQDYGVALGETMSETPETSSFDELGLEVAPLTEDVASQLGLQGATGVVITAVEAGSPAANAGLTASMVISQVGQKKVASVQEFRAAIKDQSPQKGVLLLVRSSEGSRFVVVKQ